MFDILPMYGHLKPEDQQVVTFFFYGHEDISREGVAQCHVEDGPTYEVKLRGEASAINYSLKSTQVDFGLQVCYLPSCDSVVLLFLSLLCLCHPFAHPCVTHNISDKAN